MLVNEFQEDLAPSRFFLDGSFLFCFCNTIFTLFFWNCHHHLYCNSGTDFIAFHICSSAAINQPAWKKKNFRITKRRNFQLCDHFHGRKDFQKGKLLCYSFQILVPGNTLNMGHTAWNKLCLSLLLYQHPGKFCSMSHSCPWTCPKSDTDGSE